MEKNNNIGNKIWNFINNPKDRVNILSSSSKEDVESLAKYLTNIKEQALKDEPDWDDLHKKIIDKTFHRVFKLALLCSSLKCVASILIIVGISFLSYYAINNYRVEEKSIDFAKTEIVKIDKRVAKLILADGKTVDLYSNKGMELNSSQNVSIINDSCKVLTYKLEKDIVVKLEYNTIVVPRAGEYSVKLSDGTRVFLNSESELRYPTSFQGKSRKVFLKGEAYFEVTKNKEKPFIVQLDKMNIEVLGTSFNVNAYNENSVIRTTLVEGKVKVTDDKKNTLLLTPNQQAELFDNKLTKKEVNVSNFVSWKDGKFYFDEVSLENIMIQMERWYDVNVFFVNQDSKNKFFTGVIDRAYNINEMLDMLRKVTKLNIWVKDKNIFISK